jgi:hypothetical protein
MHLLCLQPVRLRFFAPRRGADTVFPAGSARETGSAIYIVGNESDKEI